MVHNFCYPVDISGRCLFTGTDGSGYLFPFFGEIVDNSWGTCVQQGSKNCDECDNHADFTYFTMAYFFVYNLCRFVDNRI